MMSSAQLSEARGARAKLSVVFEGVEEIGRNLFEQIDKVFKTTDWPLLIETVQAGLLEGIRGLAKFLEKINYRAVGKAIGEGIERSLKQLAAFLRQTDWGIVGGEIVKGITDFLKGVDWVAVLMGGIRLLVAAHRAVLSLMLGIGKALGAAYIKGAKQGLSALGSALAGAFRSAFAGLQEIATRAVLKLIEPFTHLPKFLGSEFRKAKDALQKGLKDLEPPQKLPPRVQVAVDATETNRGRLPRSVNRTTPQPQRRPPTSPGLGGDRPSDRPIVVNTTVQLDGQAVGKSTTRVQQKQNRSDPPQRRGPNRR